jgi:hypothetical protein
MQQSLITCGLRSRQAGDDLGRERRAEGRVTFTLLNDSGSVFGMSESLHALQEKYQAGSNPVNVVKVRPC